MLNGSLLITNDITKYYKYKHLHKQRLFEENKNYEDIILK